MKASPAVNPFSAKSRTFAFKISSLLLAITFLFLTSCGGGTYGSGGGEKLRLQCISSTGAPLSSAQVLTTGSFTARVTDQNGYVNVILPPVVNYFAVRIVQNQAEESSEVFIDLGDIDRDELLKIIVGEDQTSVTASSESGIATTTCEAALEEWISIVSDSVRRDELQLSEDESTRIEGILFSSTDNCSEQIIQIEAIVFK